ncbi:MAG: RNA degradosome polyphosphate kinase, partial [Planctomycetota bacterium]
RPGVPGLSENIRVTSVLGRFLEHSRIYNFHHAGDAKWFIGSADWMSRNLDWRVEAITPVESTRLQARLEELLAGQLADKHHSWNLAGDGTWSRTSHPDDRRRCPDPQQIAMARHLERAKEAAMGG